MAIALVDGIVVEFDERERLNGIQLARRAESRSPTTVGTPACR